MQRIGRAGYARLTAKLRWRTRPDTVGQDRRPPSYPSRWDNTYRMVVADGGIRSGGWGRYLREIAKRPGWTVARIAREAGLNRTTVFDWIRDGDGRSVTVGSVLAVAAAAGDDPLVALSAAADLADGGDPEIDEILASTLPDRIKTDLIESVLDRRDREAAARRQDTRRVIRLTGGEVA